MFGEAVTSCHIRVPVSSNPKYCSVSRFSKTDSRSRMRTRTWAGAAARSVEETIGAAPPGDSRPSIPLRAGGLPLAKYSTGDCHASLRACGQRWFFLGVSSVADSRAPAAFDERLCLVTSPHEDHRHSYGKLKMKGRPRLAEPAQKNSLDLD